VAKEKPSAITKFVSVETGLKILREQSLRWHSPAMDPEPYNLGFTSSIGFTQEQLIEECLKGISGMIFGPNDPTGNGPIPKAVRRWRSEQRFGTEEEVHIALKELLTTMVYKHWEELEDVLVDWRDFVTRQRICCFSEQLEHPVPWQLYANNHTGIALRFSPDGGKDGSFKQLIKVNYDPIRPALTTVRHQARIILGQSFQQERLQDRFENHCLVKPKNTSFIKEWRALDQQDPSEINVDDSTTWFMDKPFHDDEIKAIYLGLNCPRKLLDELIDIVEERYPQVRIYRAKWAPTEYVIDFEKVFGS
jgi:hypothetical protein|tara:strand:- start:1062 stop:1979 length:918 start_codon:yes stop_codon:yes gene_type:complete